jgi:hypothetical protein
VTRIKLGDDCTKYFHAMATVTYRKNLITQLKDEADNIICDHESKAAMIWSTFRNRMGVTTDPTMHFDLQSLISLDIDLSSLVQPFSNEEIDRNCQNHASR